MQGEPEIGVASIPYHYFNEVRLTLEHNKYRKRIINKNCLDEKTSPIISIAKLYKILLLSSNERQTKLYRVFIGCLVKIWVMLKRKQILS